VRELKRQVTAMLGSRLLGIAKVYGAQG